MNGIKPCPCKDCICVPICRHKLPYILYAECSYLKEYEPNFIRYGKRNEDLMKGLADTLNPTRWVFDYDKDLETVYKMIISDCPNQIIADGFHNSPYL